MPITLVMVMVTGTVCEADTGGVGSPCPISQNIRLKIIKMPKRIARRGMVFLLVNLAVPGLLT
jgi:hypothetical protein